MSFLYRPKKVHVIHCQNMQQKPIEAITIHDVGYTLNVTLHSAMNRVPYSKLMPCHAAFVCYQTYG